MYRKDVMHVQSCCFAFKPIVPLTFSLPFASLDLKVHNIFAAAVAVVVAKAPQQQYRTYFN